MDLLAGIGLLFWFSAVVKKLLFWTWLWQLKEYHWGRMRAHFGTNKGKKIFLSPLRMVKGGLLAAFLLFSFLGLPWLLLLPLVVLFTYLVFLLETARFLERGLRGKVLSPVLTKRTAPTLGLGLLFVVGWMGGSVRWLEGAPFFEGLLAFDLLSPLLFSLLVLCFQPFVSFWKRRLLRKAKKKRESFEGLRVVAVTGSYGKTSTKDFLTVLLGGRFEVLKTKENQNSEVGIARCLLNDLEKIHEVFVCEIGAYERGQVSEMAEIVQPGIGILTGLNEQHMATFGSQENIVEGKFELMRVLPEDGVTILNGDNRLIREKVEIGGSDQETGGEVVECGLSRDMDLGAEDLKVKKEQLFFKVVSGEGEEAEVVLPLAGKQNIINFLMAAGAAGELGMGLGEIAERGGRIKATESGMSLEKSRGGVDIIDDTYSANPHGVEAALDHLQLWEGKRAVVMPCLIELGEAGKRVHREIGRRIGEVCDLALITTRDYFPFLKKGALEGGMEKESLLYLKKPEEIVNRLGDVLGEKSVLLLESRVPEKVKDLSQKL